MCALTKIVCINWLCKNNGYTSKEEFTHTTLATDVMRPRRGEAELTTVSQEGMTLGELEELVRNTTYNGFPVVTSSEENRLVGYLCRRDLIISLGWFILIFMLLTNK